MLEKVALIVAVGNLVLLLVRLVQLLIGDDDDEED